MNVCEMSDRVHLQHSRKGRLPVVGLLASVLLGGVWPVQAQDLKPAVHERVKRATVLVFTGFSDKQRMDKPYGSGSGYFINRTGMLITNNHVADPAHQRTDAEKQLIHYRAGKVCWDIIVDAGTEDEQRIPCEMVYQSDNADQAILQALDEDGNKLETPNFLPLLPESRLKDGMRLYCMGFPGGDAQRKKDQQHPEPTVTSGHCIGLPRTPGGRVRMIYTDVNVRPGNSGGPMVDLDGFLVGTATLMTKPDDRPALAGANYAALVPAALSGDMIRNAYILRKVPDGSDCTPFMEMLLDDQGRIMIPEFARRQEWDSLFFPDGDRIYGKVATPTITWESPVGTVEVPLDAVAYVMSGLEGSNLFLEGGTRLGAAEVGSSFKFTPDGGGETTMDFDRVGVVGFRSSEREIDTMPPKVLVLDSEEAYLKLTDIEGEAKLESRAGVLSVKLEDISRIDLRSDGQKVINLRDGRRITGDFTSDPIKAKIAALEVPIAFDLSAVDQATIETIRFGIGSVAGLGLSELLAVGERDVQVIVDKLEEGDTAGAREKLDKLIQDSGKFRKYPKVKQERLTLLEGVLCLREGRYDEAMKVLRKASRAGQANIAAYAAACSEVLKHYEAHEYRGKPLSDPSAFSRAGLTLARKLIKEARDFLKDGGLMLRVGNSIGTRQVNTPGGIEWVDLYDGVRRNNYTKAVRTARKLDESMRVAAVLGGAEADDELIRLWQYGKRSCIYELARLEEELRELQQGGGNDRRSTAGTQRKLQREIDQINGYRDEAIENWGTFALSLREYGFRIEDPDIQEHRESEEQPTPEGEEP